METATFVDELFRHSDSTSVSTKPVDLDNLYPALVECFGIIFIGYIAGRFHVITELEAKGMNTFVGSFSLPALIFISLCQLDLTIVNYNFILAILIAKSLLFIGVMVVTFAVSRTNRASKTGLYSIFVTQSNDFALGYPILKAIYGQTHPEYSSYMYLLAPISLVILNPIGFIILEVGRANEASNAAAEATSRWRILLQVSKGVMTNPIILMTVLGVVCSFSLGGHMPDIIAQFLHTLGSAFSATALFLLGLRMVDKMDHFKGSKIIAPLVLISLKLIAMPLISREVVSLLHAGVNETETNQLSNFAFLYGTFPTAPSVFVYASKYNVLAETIAGSMVVCTFLSAPIMFISARLLSINDINPVDYINELDNFLLDVSVIALLASLWVVFVFMLSRKFRCPPYDVTLSLVASQACGCLGAILWSLINCGHGWKLYLQFAVFAFGVYSSRLNTALLALTLVLIQMRPLCWVRRMRKYFLIIGFGIPALLVLILCLVVPRETTPHGDKTDPNFQYGVTQAYVALLILIISFVVTSISLILSQRLFVSRTFGSKRISSAGNDSSRNIINTASGDETNPLLAASPEPENVEAGSGRRPDERLVPIEDLMASAPATGNSCSTPCCAGSGPSRTRLPGRRRYRCDTDHREYCSTLVDRYNVPPAEEALDDNDEDHAVVQAQVTPAVKDEFDILRHTVLLLLLLLSMFIGIALCIWNLVMEGQTGIYLELVFLDGFLNFGQGLFAFAIFGFETKYILVPIKSWIRRRFYGRDSLILPRWEDLEEETKQICQLFIKHHISSCMEQIVRDVRVRLNVERAVFKGSDLIDWLLEVGLARDRLDAVGYGRHLVKGRVISHIDNYLDFYDDNFLYRFV